MKVIWVLSNNGSQQPASIRPSVQLCGKHSNCSPRNTVFHGPMNNKTWIHNDFSVSSKRCGNAKRGISAHEPRKPCGNVDFMKVKSTPKSNKWTKDFPKNIPNWISKQIMKTVENYDPHLTRDGGIVSKVSPMSCYCIAKIWLIMTHISFLCCEQQELAKKRYWPAWPQTHVTTIPYKNGWKPMWMTWWRQSNNLICIHAK